MYLTVSELETRAYLAGDTALSNALAQLDDSQVMVDQLENQIETLEFEKDQIVVCTCHSGYKGNK